jgi:hypothetical protein
VNAGLGDILRRYADACDNADRACVAGRITVWEKWQAKILASILRDVRLRAMAKGRHAR